MPWLLKSNPSGEISPNLVALRASQPPLIYQRSQKMAIRKDDATIVQAHNSLFCRCRLVKILGLNQLGNLTIKQILRKSLQDSNFFLALSIGAIYF